MNVLKSAILSYSLWERKYIFYCHWPFCSYSRLNPPHPLVMSLAAGVNTAPAESVPRWPEGAESPQVPISLETSDSHRPRRQAIPLWKFTDSMWFYNFFFIIRAIQACGKKLYHRELHKNIYSLPIFLSNHTFLTEIIRKWPFPLALCLHKHTYGCLHHCSPIFQIQNGITSYTVHGNLPLSPEVYIFLANIGASNSIFFFSFKQLHWNIIEIQ